jgi:hypothetical protein
MRVCHKAKTRKDESPKNTGKATCSPVNGSFLFRVFALSGFRDSFARSNDSEPDFLATVSFFARILLVVGLAALDPPY